MTKPNMTFEQLPLEILNILYQSRSFKKDATNILVTGLLSKTTRQSMLMALSQANKLTISAQHLSKSHVEWVLSIAQKVKDITLMHCKFRINEAFVIALSSTLRRLCFRYCESVSQCRFLGDGFETLEIVVLCVVL